MTLTELSYYSRRFFPLLILGFIFLLIIFYFFKLILLLSTFNKQQSVISHSPVFGKIKSPIITNATDSARFDYILDTIEGEPVTATLTAKIYFLPPKGPRLGYREKAFLMAKNFGFDTENVNYKLENNEAVFLDANQKLVVNINTFNFFYQYFFENDFALFEESVIPDSKTIENKGIDFLKKINCYPEELALGKININLLKYDYINKAFIKVLQPSDANTVEINFYRQDIDSFPVVTANFPSSQNYLLIVFNESDFKILRGQIKFFEKSNDEYGVYLLNNGDEIWKKLKEGKGYIINMPKEKNKIVIKKMFLAYYDPDIYQPYLQPVYVFVGEPDFTAFVPAVVDNYLE